jgi:hypothetical protein
MDRVLVGPCIPWTGPLTPRGYGRTTANGRRQQAHRLAYETKYGPIPPKMQLDHLCHTLDPSCGGGVGCPHRRCVNPEHLEIVTPRENVLRGRGQAAMNVLKTHCPAGHAYTEANTRISNGKRYCRACDRARDGAKSALRAAKAAAEGREPGRRGRPGGPERPPGYYRQAKLASMTILELAEYRRQEAQRARERRQRQKTATSA